MFLYKATNLSVLNTIGIIFNLYMQTNVPTKDIPVILMQTIAMKRLATLGVPTSFQYQNRPGVNGCVNIVKTAFPVEQIMQPPVSFDNIND